MPRPATAPPARGVGAESRRRLTAAIGVISLALAGGAPLAAQQLRGTVVRADSTTRAAGILVELVAPGGAVVQRALSSARGEFSFTAPDAGTYTARALRVGFRPSLSTPLLLTRGTTTTTTLVLNAVTVSLEAVSIISAERCRLRPDSGQLVARVWNEAVTALQSSRLVAADEPLLAEWITYRRTTDPRDQTVSAQQVRTTRAPTTSVFRSWDPDSLARRGYVIEGADGLTYHAPDANVLLGDRFAASHCFRLVRAAADSAALIGVAFEPAGDAASDADDRSDVVGTFWVDRRSAELRALDFHYTNVPELPPTLRAAGHVEFVHLTTGHWIVSRWWLRMPVVAVQNVTQTTARLRYSRSELSARELRTVGGEVLAVTHDRATIFTGALPSLHLQVVSRDPRHPVAGTAVRLEGTDYEVAVDSTGRATLSQVLPGRYGALVRSPLIELSRASPAGQMLTVRPATSDRVIGIDTVAVPTADEILRLACGKEVADAGGAMLYGFVRNTRGLGVPDVSVTALWLGDWRRVASDVLNAHNEGEAVRSGEMGEFRICGVPRDRKVTLRAETDSSRVALAIVVTPQEALRAVDLPLSTATTDVIGPDAALLELLVTSSTNEPLGDVILDLSNGPWQKRVRTSERGLALVPNVPPGVIAIRARRVGFQMGDLAAIVEAGRNTVPLHLDPNRAPVLDTVRVMGSKRVSARLDEFETRLRIKAATAFVTRADIERRNPVDTWQLLTAIPSVKIVSLNGTSVAQSARGSRPSLLAPNLPCNFRLMVNGLLIPTQGDGAAAYTDLSYLPPPAEIYGIEVFAGASSIPLQYGGSGADKWCGLIAVWTR